MKNKIYELDEVFSFGRYKGKTVRELLKENPGYVDWIIRNVDSFALSEEAMQQALEITEGKKFSKEEAYLNRINQPILIIFRKIYGWSFDFSDEELIKINRLKLDNFRENKIIYNYRIPEKNEYDTDWSYYNDDLDMDQQSEEFWNQF